MRWPDWQLSLTDMALSNSGDDETEGFSITQSGRQKLDTS